jgi:hypothetical protein
MQYYRCKCGSAQSWTSMGVSRCSKCSTCGSDLAQSPDSHRDPEPHSFVAGDVETDAGPAPLSRCQWCGYTRKQLAKSEGT